MAPFLQRALFGNAALDFIVFLLGRTGTISSFGIPPSLGGKPFFSPIFPFPVMYELTILLAAFGTFFGMFIMNRLPSHNHPVFEHPGFNRTGDDKFLIVIEIEDPKFEEDETSAFLKKIGGKSVTLIREPEDF